MPPGGGYRSEERPPDAVYYFRVFGGLVCVCAASAMLLGLTGMFAPLVLHHRFGGGGAYASWFLGIFELAAGAAYLTPTALVLFGGRRPWVHTLGMVVIVLAMLQVCCAPLLIPLLIAWLEPATRRWYGAR